MSDISPGNLNHNAHQAWQKIMGGWRGGNGLYADVTIYRRANIFISYRASYLFFIFNIDLLVFGLYVLCSNVRMTKTTKDE